jgi:hypothetical protein
VGSDIFIRDSPERLGFGTPLKRGRVIEYKLTACQRNPLFRTAPPLDSSPQLRGFGLSRAVQYAGACDGQIERG